MIEKIDVGYVKRRYIWVCKKCELAIYSGKNYKKTFCGCLNNKNQYEIYTNYLSSFYNRIGEKWICKQCSSPIGANREQHALKCNTEKIEQRKFSLYCDLGCGCETKFFYKTGKAYCSKLGNSCPIKKHNDSLKKIGVNPFKNTPHHKAMLGKKPHNKGLTQETSAEVLKNTLAIKEYIRKNGHSWTGKSHNSTTKQKLSRVAMERILSGSLNGAKNFKKGWYKGIFCDSSWELAYVIYCSEHNISVKRNTERRTYLYNGEVKGYLPDFLVNNDLIEIKGYITEQWKAKLLYNSDIITLYKDEMKPILKYVINKYGKDFIKLYEDN